MPYDPPKRTGAGAGAAVLGWGSANIGSTTSIRYLGAWYDTANAQTTNTTQMRAPFAGTVRNMFVRHNLPGGSGPNVTYTLYKNAAATALSVTMATGIVGHADETSTDVVVAQGDALTVRVDKATSIGSASTETLVTVELAAA